MSSLPTQIILGFYALTRAPHWGAAAGKCDQTPLVCWEKGSPGGWVQAGAVDLPPEEQHPAFLCSVGGKPWLDDAQRKLPSAALLCAPALPLLFQLPPGSPMLFPGGCAHPAPSLGPCSTPGVEQGGSASPQPTSHPSSIAATSDDSRRAV